MSYSVDKASVRLACSRCCAFTVLSAPSVAAVLRDAREQGWRLQPNRCKRTGVATCPECVPVKGKRVR